MSAHVCVRSHCSQTASPQNSQKSQLRLRSCSSSTFSQSTHQCGSAGVSSGRFSCCIACHSSRIYSDTRTLSSHPRVIKTISQRRGGAADESARSSSDLACLAARSSQSQTQENNLAETRRARSKDREQQVCIRPLRRRVKLLLNSNLASRATPTRRHSGLLLPPRLCVLREIILQDTRSTRALSSHPGVIKTISQRRGGAADKNRI